MLSLHTQRLALHGRLQRGGILIFTALGMGLVLACLLVLDIGNVIWQKREIQKIADLAAVAGASDSLVVSCSAQPNASAAKNAASNGLGASDDFRARSGIWKPVADVEVGSFFNGDADEKHNACNVEITRKVPFFVFWTGESSQQRTIYARATAVASVEPRVTVAVRTTLAAVNEGMLNVLLRAVTNSTVSLDALGWEGLAEANVNLLQVFDHLIEADIDLGGYQSVLDSEIGISRLVQAMVKAVEPGKILQTDLNAINALENINFGATKIRLGDLIRLENVNPGSGLDFGINALELFQGALQLAAKKNALGLDLDIASLLKVKLQVVEPPQIAVIGNPEDKSVVIEARTAQIRLWAALGVISNPAANFLKEIFDLLINILTSVLKLILDIQILPKEKNLDKLNLDLIVDVARGYVRVKNADCNDENQAMEVEVEKSASDIYLGQIAGASLADREKNAFGPSIPVVTPLTILEVGRRVCVLTICGSKDNDYYGRIRLGGHLKINAIAGSEGFEKKEVNNFGGLKEDDEGRKYYTVLPSNLAPISSLLQGINLLDVDINAGLSQNQILSVVDLLLEHVLTPVLGVLNPLGRDLDGLLSALGVNVNEMEVAPYLSCGGSADLVY